MPAPPPRIGITLDSRLEPAGGTSPRTCHTGSGYGDAVAAAGGVPLCLGHHAETIPHLLDICDAFILTGGGDPDTSAFGVATHSAARLVDPRRQAFELALLDALETSEHAGTPLLGVCLGMQMMCLHAGGMLDQAMTETMGEAAAIHADFQPHAIRITAETAVLPAKGTRHDVISSHRQRVSDPGRLEVAALAEDATIEAVHDPSRPWRVGVQWHAERTRDASHPVGWGLIASLVQAAASSP
ncbi:MAG: gamma-glutamyl-gamma-aminobutyrate hydrolase family protein [Phycisphaeraceae bacterium]